MPDPAALGPPHYEPRHADASPLYRLALDHHERFAVLYDDLYAGRYGDWRPEVLHTFRRFLDCRILAFGFLRVRCDSCGHEVRVPWSCKKVAFCPRCAQRRAHEFGEFVDREILEPVPYVHLVATVPKVLRATFLREWRLLRELSRCVRTVVKRALHVALGRPSAIPGAVAALATAGDLLNGNPHVHVILSAGAWSGSRPGADFLPWPPWLTAERLAELLRRSVLAMLQRRQRLTEQTAARLLSWEHPGFSAWFGEPIQPWQTESRQRLARYLVKPPVSLERIDYDESRCQVVYSSNKRGQSRSMSALDFLGELSVHLPDRGTHGVLYYGRHSKRSRGERARARALLEASSTAPSQSVLSTSAGTGDADPDADPLFLQKRKAFRLSWAALLKKVWHVDAMRCPQCTAQMSIVSAITDIAVAERILKHVGLLDRPRPPNSHDCSLTPPTAAATPLLWEAAPPLSADDGGDQGTCQDGPVDPPFNDGD